MIFSSFGTEKRGGKEKERGEKGALNPGFCPVLGVRKRERGRRKW